VDQASIDTAQANLSNAQQALAGANLVSTIAGTVASVSIAVGDSVTAGSTTAQVVVIGTGSAFQVSTAIPVTDIGKVAIGQQATVTPDSTNSVESGRVSAIGVLGTTTTSTTTYPVTIALDSTALGQFSGAYANVSIVVQRSVGVTTVPTSAVHTVGSEHVVDVVDGSTVKQVKVTTGTVGDILTQITSGVHQGQLISLATMSEPLPSTSTTTTRFGGLAGASGLTGAGGFGGGAAGGFGGGGGFGGRAGFGG
jgi:multidrug efflux pump subunit AcrA (membrane-fusion protein)